MIFTCDKNSAEKHFSSAQAQDVVSKSELVSSDTQTLVGNLLGLVISPAWLPYFYTEADFSWSREIGCDGAGSGHCFTCSEWSHRGPCRHSPSSQVLTSSQRRNDRHGRVCLTSDTGNLRAVQLLLGHTKMDSTVRYLGVELEDALAIAEAIEI